MIFSSITGGGASTRLGETVHIFNIPTPRPQLRWSPDGAAGSKQPLSRPLRRPS